MIQDPVEQWPDAVLAAAVLATDPAGHGIRLRARAGPAREAWLAVLRTLLPYAHPIRRCPANIADDRLLGGLDLTATMASGHRVACSGLLAEADDGLVVVPMAERLSIGLAARLASVLDSGEIALERDGLTGRRSARLGVVALDEGYCDDELPPPALLDRLALVLTLDDAPSPPVPAGLALTVHQARARFGGVVAGDAVLDALCRTAMLAGIASIRAPLQAVQVARAIAALAGRGTVADADAARAARMVLAPRATRLPDDATAASGEPEEPGPDGEPRPPEPDATTAEGGPEPGSEPAPGPDSESGPKSQESPAAAGSEAGDGAGGDTRETVLSAVRGALPPGLLLRPLGSSGTAALRASATGGKVEAKLLSRRTPAMRGRSIGVRPGDPARGRLNVLATLCAALPWQVLRQVGRPVGSSAPAATAVRVRREDFRLTRYAPRLRVTTIFAVDASGSSARYRLAEAKGCVELLLAECYIRRDQVALIAFRGRGGELVLPPTASVARARRALDGLPGGGGTPLASGLDAALALADRLRRTGDLAMLVVLTDARANVARDGIADRDRAERDALESARRVRAAGLATLLVDISPRPNERAAAFAGSMGARYLALPHADALTLTRAVQAAMPTL